MRRVSIVSLVSCCPYPQIFPSLYFHSYTCLVSFTNRSAIQTSAPGSQTSNNTPAKASTRSSSATNATGKKNAPSAPSKAKPSPTNSVSLSSKYPQSQTSTWKRLSSRWPRISRNVLLIRAVVRVLLRVELELVRLMLTRVRVLRVVWGRIAVREVARCPRRA